MAFHVVTAFNMAKHEYLCTGCVKEMFDEGRLQNGDQVRIFFCDCCQPVDLLPSGVVGSLKILIYGLFTSESRGIPSSLNFTLKFQQDVGVFCTCSQCNSEVEIQVTGGVITALNVHPPLP